MPRQTEPNVNNALGDTLRGMMPGCEVRSENTQTFPDYPGRHADVLIAAPGRSPVVVEAEYEPAAEVEKDASDRLGLRVEGQPRTVEAAIAVRYPKVLEDAYDVRQALSEARLCYYVLHQEGTRFPESGWLAKPYDVWNSQLHSPSNLCTILYTEGKIARRRPDEPSVHAGRGLTHDQLLQWVWGPEKTGQPWLVREVV